MLLILVHAIPICICFIVVKKPLKCYVWGWRYLEHNFLTYSLLKLSPLAKMLFQQPIILKKYPKIYYCLGKLFIFDSV